LHRRVGGDTHTEGLYVIYAPRARAFEQLLDGLAMTPGPIQRGSHALARALHRLRPVLRHHHGAVLRHVVDLLGAAAAYRSAALPAGRRRTARIGRRRVLDLLPAEFLKQSLALLGRQRARRLGRRGVRPQDAVGQAARLLGRAFSCLTGRGRRRPDAVGAGRANAGAATDNDALGDSDDKGCDRDCPMHTSMIHARVTS